MKREKYNNIYVGGVNRVSWLVPVEVNIWTLQSFFAHSLVKTKIIRVRIDRQFFIWLVSRLSAISYERRPPNARGRAENRKEEVYRVREAAKKRDMRAENACLSRERRPVRF